MNVLMKANTYKSYGTIDVLEYKDIPIPVPKDNEVLIKVKAACINPADKFSITGQPFPIRFFVGGLMWPPQNFVLGCDVAGVIEMVGKNIKDFSPGDEVFGDLSPCGLGAFGEFVTATEGCLLKKPNEISFEDCACLPSSGVAALTGLVECGKIDNGHKVLINGASGGVGTFAVQIAKAYGAEVTAICRTDKINEVKNLGADHVIDYTTEDFLKSGLTYDIILDCAAYCPPSDYEILLKEKGNYVLIGGEIRNLVKNAFITKRGEKTFSSVYPDNKSMTKYFQSLVELMKAGQLKPYISKVFKLDQVKDALKMYEERNFVGKIAISVN